jgi:hypothetical protein
VHGADLALEDDAAGDGEVDLQVLDGDEVVVPSPVGLSSPNFNNWQKYVPQACFQAK